MLLGVEILLLLLGVTPLVRRTVRGMPACWIALLAIVPLAARLLLGFAVNHSLADAEPPGLLLNADDAFEIELVLVFVCLLGAIALAWRFREEPSHAFVADDHHEISVEDVPLLREVNEAIQASSSYPTSNQLIDANILEPAPLKAILIAETPAQPDLRTRSSWPLMLSLGLALLLLVTLVGGGVLYWKWQVAEERLHQIARAEADAAAAQARRAEAEARERKDLRLIQEEAARQREDAQRRHEAAELRQKREEEQARVGLLEIFRLQQEQAAQERIQRERAARAAQAQYFTEIRSIQSDIDQGNDDAKNAAWFALERCNKDQRGWEWYHLYRRMRGGLAITDCGSQSCLALSADGRFLAIGFNETGRNGYIKVVDLKTGRDIHFFRGHDHNVVHVAFHPDGKRLVSLDRNDFPWELFGTAKVWDLATGRELLVLPKRDEQVKEIALSPDGRWLATGQEKGGLKVWDLDAGKVLKAWSGHPPEIHGLAFSPDSKTLASCGKDKTVRVWDFTTGAEKQSSQEFDAPVVGVAFNADGTQITAVDKTRNVTIWDLAAAKLIRTPPREGQRARGFTLSQDGRYVVADAEGGFLVKWDVASGKRLFRFPGLSPTRDILIGPDGERLFFMTGHLQTCVSDASASPAASLFCRSPVKDLHRLAFAADGKLAVSGWDHEVKIFDGDGTRPILTLSGHSKDVGALAFSRDGKLLASGSDDMLVKVWDAVTGREVFHFRNHRLPVRDVAFTPDGKKLISVAQGDIHNQQRSREVKFWDLETGLEYHSLVDSASDDASSFALNANGTRMALAEGESLQVWAGDGKRMQWSGPRLGPIRSVAFSPDGQHLAVSHARGLIVLRNSSGTESLRLDAGSRAQHVAFTPDSRRLITCGADGLVRLWDVATGALALTLRGHTADLRGVRHAAFSPDGITLATLSCLEGGEVRLWHSGHPPRGERLNPALIRGK